MNISPTQLPDGNDQTTQRPDLVPGVPLLLSGGVQNHTIPINPAAFAPPPLDPSRSLLWSRESIWRRSERSHPRS